MKATCLPPRQSDVSDDERLPLDVLASLSSELGAMTGSDLLLRAQELAAAKALGAVLYHSGKATHSESESEYQQAWAAYVATLANIRDAVAELIARDSWISVSEALPDDPDEEVIVWRLYDKRQTGRRCEEWEADTSRWDGEEWLFGGMTDFVQVTHWRRMPLGPNAALARVGGGA